jgi:aryl-alcohol dehydrogenase-like predicted oxidoreductase
VIATKAGLERPGPDRWVPNGRPDYLVAACKASLKRLGLERIDLWQLHRIDPKVPRDEQFGAVRQLLDEGYIRFAGLSQASIEDIEAASRVFPVATTQNRYSLDDTGDDAVLAYCEKHAIGFIPWYPLAAGALAKGASREGVTASQHALAWLLKRSPVMLPIPGTSKVKHLEENAAAAAVELG